MIREPHIPLFLWIATALVVHAIGGEGATEVAQVLEERMDIRSFASSVRTRAMRSAEPLEVSLETDPVPEEPHEEDLEPHEHHVDTERVDDHELPQAAPDPIAPKPEEKPQEKEKAPEPEKKADEAKPADEAAQKLALLDNRRIAVQQKVEDENQADNPNAEFAGDHANHVKEQTQARITSTDQNDANPTPGGNFSSSDPNPGNSEDQKVAQSEEKAGEKDAPPDDSGEAEKPTEASQASASATTPAKAAAAAAAAAAQRPSTEVRPSTASPEVTGAPEVIAQGQGPGGVDRPKQSSQARAEQKWKPAVKAAPTDLLGYGSNATTSRGVNLNLSRSSALAIIGADHMATLKKRAGEKRLSAHRGSFQNLGIERWRSAIENYISTVKPGNQTALNTARVPFAAYLNQIHQRLHSIFADDFLGSLEGLPADHPLSNLDMSTHIEIALDRQDGSIVKMGVTKSSGVTMFDVGALESVKKAAPYGVPPGSIVSSDGNVYFHWEFHRRPVYACSTYFARPFILNVGPEQAPPRVEPPRRPTSDEQPPDSRSGALTQKRTGKGV